MVARWFHFFFVFPRKTFRFDQSSARDRFKINQPLNTDLILNRSRAADWSNWKKIGKKMGWFFFSVLANLGVNAVDFGCSNKKYPPFYSTTCPVLFNNFSVLFNNFLFYSTTTLRHFSTPPLQRGKWFLEFMYRMTTEVKVLLKPGIPGRYLAHT